MVGPLIYICLLLFHIEIFKIFFFFFSKKKKEITD